MSNKPRDWPNNAREARDRASEAAAEIIKALDPLIEEERNFTETEQLRRASKARNLAQIICRLMEEQGAQTRA